MATWTVRAVRDDGSYVNGVFCHTLCKFSDPEYISTRDTGVLSLFSFDGIASNRNYEVQNRTAPTTIFDIMAPVAVADTTIQFAPEAADYLEAGQLVIIKNEQVIIVSVDATGLATVTRGPNAEAYTDEDYGFIIGKPTDFCETSNCYVNDGKCKIQNAIYRSNYCVQTCKEELCENINFNPKCDDPSILADEVDRLIAERAVMATRELNRLALHGRYREWNSTQTGTTRGILETAYGVEADNGKILTGVLYDVAEVADNSCADIEGGKCINGSNWVRLLQEYFDRVDMKEGKHNVVIMNTKVKQALRDAIYQCTDSCGVGSKWDPVAFASLDRIDAGPLGILTVVEDNSMSNDKIVFAHTDNLKWFGHCSSNGQLRELKTVTDNEGFIEKYETTIKVAFDATQNMCSDLGIIHGFEICDAC